MAKTAHKRSRNSKNFVAIPVEGNLALSTLGSQAVLSANLIEGTLTEDIFVISSDLSASITGLSAGEGSPHELGIAHSDYTDVEIKENLDVVLLGPGSKIELERTRRLVRKVGVANTFVNSGQTILEFIEKNGSRIIRTKWKFTVQNGKTLDIWVQNRSGATLTTGATLRWSGTIYGRWLI